MHVKLKIELESLDLSVEVLREMWWNIAFEVWHANDEKWRFDSFIKNLETNIPSHIDV